MIRNVIFDWSGTLLDDLPAVWKTTNHIFRQAGLPELSLDQFRASFCLPFQKFYDRFTPNVPMNQIELWFHGHFPTVQDEVRELPHARAFLLACQKRGVRMFVLTTVHSGHFEKQAIKSDLRRFFERVYAGIVNKEVAISQVLEENRLLPDETLFIGDMRHDIDAAKAGAIHSCAVLTGYTALDQLRLSEPELIVEHLGELQARLDEQGWEWTAAPQRPVATVGALIFNPADQVLMIRTHKWSNLWGIPGGKVKFGEPAVHALQRELREETGLEVSDIRFVLVQDCIHSKEFYRDAHFILLNYTCRSSGETQVTLNDEAQAYRWTTLAEALQLPLNQPTRTLIEAVMAGKGH